MRLKAGKGSWERYLDSKHSILDPQDRISTLPEPVLNHMMSFLSSSERDVARFLSRKWRRLNAQDQTVLCLTRHRLNELEFPKILNDDFHSLEFLSLYKCPGMRNLRLDNFKLDTIYINYCGTLKTVQLKTPNLETLFFNAPRIRPCVIEFINCKKLRTLHLVGVAMDTMMFINCNESFPVLEVLSLAGCDMSGCINISSHSIQNLSFIRFNKHVGLNIDAPNLVSFKYDGTTVPIFQNINFPRLVIAYIDLHPNRYQKRREIWFIRLIEMLRGLKHAVKLDFCTTSEKNLIIPQQLREFFAPPLDEILCIEVRTNSRHGSMVDLADSMLWVCPRVSNLFCCSGFFQSALQLFYGELSFGLPASLCNFCTSPSSRCWRHSVTGYTVSHTREEARNEMTMYLLENLETAGRDDTDWTPLDLVYSLNGVIN